MDTQKKRKFGFVPPVPVISGYCERKLKQNDHIITSVKTLRLIIFITRKEVL